MESLAAVVINFRYFFAFIAFFFDHRIIDNECRLAACGKKSRKYYANPVNQPSPIVSAIAQKTVNTAFIDPFVDPFEFAAKNRVYAGHEHERHRQYDE